MRTLITVVLTIVVLLIMSVAGFYFYFSRGSFSARQKPGWLEATAVGVAQELAMPKDADKLKNPYPASAAVLEEAQMHFTEHCAVCHGPDGKGQTMIGKNVYPQTPDLTGKDTQDASDGELYYIIQNGIRFSAMPSFEATHSKDEIWQLVAFVRHVPKLTPQEVQAITEGMAAVTAKDIALEHRHGQHEH